MLQRLLSCRYHRGISCRISCSDCFHTGIIKVFHTGLVAAIIFTQVSYMYFIQDCSDCFHAGFIQVLHTGLATAIVFVQVSWKRQHESHPLTIGRDVFASAASISVESSSSLTDHGQRVTEWRLVIDSVRRQDAGLYHCKLTARHLRRRAFDVRLHVKGIAEKVRVTDGKGFSRLEKMCVQGKPCTGVRIISGYSVY